MEITKEQILAYKRRLESLGLAPASVRRRMAAVKRFCAWAAEKGYLKENPFAPTRLRAGVASGVRLERAIAKIRRQIRRLPAFSTLSNIYETYNSISITRYLHWAILIIFCAALGFGAYDQFFRKTPTPMAYPTTLTPPKRYLSFQGRLTDSSNNPITSATNMVFKLYNVSSGGTALWDSGPCSITPDQDGIFSVLLGTTSGDGYSCPSASEIDASVFTENAEVWLGITVDTDAEMTPRIQIATVGYALNAETLQGFPPASPSAINTIPIVNSDGNIVIAAASPAIQSTSGTFGIKGQALTLTTATGSNGNITLAPDGSGVLNLTLSSGTGNLMNATDANLGSSGQKEENTLYYGAVANDNTNFNLLKLESGSTPTPKFTVDASGNASAAGNLRILGGADNYFAGSVGIGTTSPAYALDVAGTVNMTGFRMPTGAQAGYVLTSDGSGTGTWADVSSTAGPWTLSGSNLYPDSTSYNVGIGTTDPGSYKLYVAGTANVSTSLTTPLVIGSSSLALRPTTDSTTAIQLQNAGGTSILNIDTTNSRVGIGTTAPLEKLDVSGNATVSGNLTLAGGERTIAARSMNALTLGDASTGNIQFYSSSNYITSSGNLVLAGSLSAAGTKFQVDSNGDIVKLKNLTYSWPSSHTADGFLKNDGSGNLTWTTIAQAGGVTGTGVAGQATFWTGTSTVGGDNAFWWDNTNKRLGIGTTEPTYKLDIADSSTTRGINVLNTTASSYGVYAVGTSYGVYGSNGTTSGYLGYNDQYGLYTANNAYVGGTLTLGTVGSVSDNNQVLTVDSGVVKYIDTSGWDKNAANDVTTFLGLTDTPSSYTGSGGYLVKVNAGESALEFVDPSGLGTNYWTLSGSNLYPDSTSYNVGIGTTDPGSYKLYVAGTANVSTSLTTPLVIGSSSLALRPTTDSTTAIQLQNAGGTSILNIDTTNQRVGIGTTAPLEKLDVSGNATVSGNLTLAGGERTIAARSMNALTLGDASTGNIQFYSSSNYITSSGNLVLAGTVSSPTFQGNSGAVTFGNASYGTTITGSSLTIVPTSWTATPTISGLVTMTSGFDSNASSTVTNLTIDGTSGTALNISNSGITTDISLQNGETIDNDTDGTIRLGATTLTLNGTTTFTASSLQTFTTASSLAMSSTTSLTLGGNSTIYGGSAASGTLTLSSTSNATKGNLQFFSSSNYITSSGNLVLAGVLDINGAGTSDIAGTLNLSGDTLTSSGDLTINPAGGGAKIGTGTPSYIDMAGGDLYISGDLEVTGGTTVVGALRLINNQILNSAGTATIILSSTSTTNWNVLDAGAWQVYNTANVGQAALVVDQTMGGDIFTASASGTPKFTITNNGDVDIASLNAGGLVKAAATTGRLSIATGGTDYEYPLTFSNGLTRTANTVKLGGALTASTDIPLSGFNLTFSGTGNVGIGTTSPTHKLELADHTTEAEGIGIGSDVAIYRSASETLSLKADYVLPATTPGANTITTTETSNNSAQLAMALTATDSARVAYYDSTNQDLRYYVCWNNDCTSRTVTTLDSTNRVGESPAIALDSNGYAQIAYFYYTGWDLKFIQCTNADCTSKNTTTIDDLIGNYAKTIDVGWTSTDGYPRIAYNDSDYTVHFVQCTNASCTTKVNTTVTAANYGLQYISLTLDSSGYGYLLVSRVTDNYPYYIRCTNASCSTNSTATIDSVASTYGDVKLGSDGYPRFCYYDSTNTRLKFAVCDDANCSSKTTTVVDSGNVGQYCSLALDSSNLAYITYYDDTNDSLKLARCGNNTCSQKTILTLDATSNMIPSSKSLKMGSDGKIRITYYDNTNSRMKFFVEGAAGAKLGSSAYYWDEVNAKYYITRGTADIAEIYQSEEVLEPGDLVMISQKSTKEKPLITKTNTSYSPYIAGVISKNPGLLLGGEKQLEENAYPIALAGRAEVKVSNLNGKIMTGDPIASSKIAGVGMKATSASFIIGKALETFDPENGIGTAEPCPEIENPSICGRIMVLVNPSWYDPEVYFTNTGELQITKIASDSSILTETNNEESQISNLKSQIYSLKLKTGEIIERIGAFSEAVIANLKAGLIQTSELLVDQKIVSPLVETQEVKTDIISPLLEEGLTIKLSDLPTASDSGETKVSKFKILNEQNLEVASIDSQGNASFAGTVNSEQLTVKSEATVAGTLYADKIVAGEIVGLKGTFGELLGATVSATYTGEQLRGNSEELTANSEEAEASESGKLSQEEIEAMVNEILNTSLEATPQAELAESQIGELQIINNLSVLGATSLSDTTIAGSLNIGGTLNLAENSLNSLGGTLYIQNLGLGGIDLLAGKVRIDEHGNAIFEGDVEVRGRLAVGEIAPLEEQDMVINLASVRVDQVDQVDQVNQESKFGKLLVKGANNEVVASIDASGSAKFAGDLVASGSGTFQKIIIANNSQQSTANSEQSIIETNATAGEAVLPVGATEITIKSPFVTEKSLIYVTPTSSTGNKVLYVKAKKASNLPECLPETTPGVSNCGWFKVGIDERVTNEIRFNWWIIN